MPLFVQALVMGIVQGLTEFLPISSSGHLIVVPTLMGWNDPFIDSLLFSVMLHMGTLVALIVYFARDWLALIPAFVGLVRDRSTAGDQDRRLVRNLILATIPAAIAGALLNDFVERTVRQPTLVAILLVVGAGILWWSDRVGKKLYGMDGLSGIQAFVIGVAQAFALLPGISRSGISIAMGLLTGLDREAAARFSFLMATPIIAGAGIFEARKLFGPGAPPASDLALVVIGFVAALVAGLVAIRFMLQYLRNNSLGIFVAYRVVLAVVVLVVLFGR